MSELRHQDPGCRPIESLPQPISTEKGNVRPIAPLESFRQRWLRITGGCLLANSLCVGAESDDVEAACPADLRRALVAFWNAFLVFARGELPNALPNWHAAYALLHPDALAACSLAQFNRQQWAWLQRQRGPISRIRIYSTTLIDDGAVVEVLINFGLGQIDDDSCLVRTELRKHGHQWAVAALAALNE